VGARFGLQGGLGWGVGVFVVGVCGRCALGRVYVYGGMFKCGVDTKAGWVF
jgi:hypothetical protein